MVIARTLPPAAARAALDRLGIIIGIDRSIGQWGALDFVARPNRSMDATLQYYRYLFGTRSHGLFRPMIMIIRSVSVECHEKFHEH
jgi:hypothetical protein